MIDQFSQHFKKIYTNLKRCPGCKAEHSNLLGEVEDSLTRELNRILPNGPKHLPSITNSLHECSNCGLKFLNPRLTAEHLKRLYAVWYKNGYSASIASLEQDSAREVEFENYHLAFIETILPNGGRILDVGTGTGTFVKVAQSKGWDALGIDWSEAAIEQARNKGIRDVQVSTLKAVQQSAERFDVVSMFDYLEHSETPLSDVMMAAACLRPGGILAIRVPNANGLQAKVAGMSWGGLFSLHLTYFSIKSLEHLLSKSGLEPVFQDCGNYQSVFQLAAKKIQWLSAKIKPREFGQNNNPTARFERLRARARLWPYVKGSCLELIDHFGGWIGRGNQLFVIWKKPGEELSDS